MDYSREDPGTVAHSPEVSLLDPPPALLTVTLAAPPPEYPEDAVVHRRENALTRRKTMVHRPAFDLLIQTPDHVTRRHAPRVVNGFLDLGQERLDAPLRRLGENLAVAMTPDRLTQK